MPKTLNRNEAKHLAALINQIPAPTPSDIAKVKLAAMECRSIKHFCEFLEIDKITFKHWVNTNIEFRKAYRSWRDFATEEVEFAVAKKAVGFIKRTRKQILTRQGSIETLVQEEYFPPDSAAQAMWLKNRNGKEWKDTQQIDVNVQTNIRAWLIGAMEDAPQDDSEVINVTPTLIENEPALNTILIEQENSIEPAIEISGDTSESEQQIAARDNGYNPSPAATPDIASLNARWGS